MAKVTKKIAVEMTKKHWLLAVDALDNQIMKFAGIDASDLGDLEKLKKLKSKKVTSVVKEMMEASEEILSTLRDAGELTRWTRDS